jgi:hypothetical protein
VFLGFGYTWVMRLSVSFCGVFMVIWLMRTARVTWTISVIQVFKFIGFVYVIKAVRVIITLNEYAKASRSVRHQVSGNDGWI